jgi:hypothetical protein
VKACRGANALGLALEGSTARQLRLFELLNTVEMAVDEGRIGERPQMFSGLQFWRVGREKQEVDVVRHAQTLRAMPAGAIQDEDDLLAGTRTHGLGKCHEFGFKERHAHGRGQVKDRAS